MKKNRTQQSVAEFYNGCGWDTHNEVTEDAELWEDLREFSQDYVKQCRLRVIRHIPLKGDKLLDMASGPIQYDEYLSYSKNYNKRYCIDLSPKALEAAKKKIGNHGEFYSGDFLEMHFDDNMFDCSVSMHTIYHIDKSKQEEAVRKLIRVTKPGAPIIIVYGNPDTLIHFFKKTFTKLLSVFNGSNQTATLIYGHTFPISWWKRYEDVANVKIYPWRSFSAQHQKLLFPNSKLGHYMFRILWKLEESFPGLFVRYFQYPMVVMKKHSSV